MSTELRVTLPGPAGTEDARQALKVLDRVLSLLGHLENAQTHRDGSSPWGFTGLGLGSVVATLAPSEAGAVSKPKVLTNVMRLTVEGFEQAEREEGVPEGWDYDAAGAGAEISHLLGQLRLPELKLDLLENQIPVRSVVVTRVSEQHLRRAMRRRQHSIGSVIGRIDSITVHDRFEAGLWPEAGGSRVAVKFTAAQRADVAAVLGKRIEASGGIERSSTGQVIAIKLRAIDLLADEAPPLTDLVGLDLNLTGGRDLDDYLGEMRGAA